MRVLEGGQGKEAGRGFVVDLIVEDLWWRTFSRRGVVGRCVYDKCIKSRDNRNVCQDFVECLCM